ncbi:uncharacterized protein PITG_14448 [Phytophthora infestans T30-4]|uniref:Uncharacterized protein n=1 Tax=Phytophthora infestans (strain T30-4) TaxID=403677 RepID=D0NPV6_PHYIT|nr:uncharacterized protein PITG_14448 [Phytophthora infestans T30-4]EEY62668.1 hypothetical protein PITG_14448 [Phytophthora infestans T30-4]|eukprot:XP_002898910.1 hypothetical protein PITG_14448 [Phytophthora infestans T30-4]
MFMYWYLYEVCTEVQLLLRVDGWRRVRRQQRRRRASVETGARVAVTKCGDGDDSGRVAMDQQRWRKRVDGDEELEERRGAVTMIRWTWSARCLAEMRHVNERDVEKDATTKGKKDACGAAWRCSSRKCSI